MFICADILEWKTAKLENEKIVFLLLKSYAILKTSSEKIN